MDSVCPHTLISIIACILERVVSQQDMMADVSPISRFTALQKSNISISDYLERIYHYSHCSSECLLLSLIYIDRLIQSNKIAVNSLSIHRILITSLVIAAKFFDDRFFVNSYYAKVGGLSTEELNSLEIEFLYAINFTLLVNAEDYQNYHNELYRHVEDGLCPCCRGLHIPYMESAPSSPSLQYVYKSLEPSSPCNVWKMYEHC